MRFFIHRLFAILFCFAMFLPVHLFCQTGKSQLKTVVIDPGHGGHDPGAIAGGINEKDLVLSVALRLGNKIKYQFPGVKVIYTRSRDIFIPLYERAAIANRNNADVFISIHANFVAEKFVTGSETFTLGLHRSQENLEVAKKENSVILLEDDYSTNYQGFDPNEPESYIMFENMQAEYQSQSIGLASDIQDEFRKNLNLNNRGVKQAGFLVLRRTSMPCVLIEIGFISNATERKFLISESGKEKVAESVFRAFSNYKTTIDLKSHFDLNLPDQILNQKEVTGNEIGNTEKITGANDRKNAGEVEKMTDTIVIASEIQFKNTSDSLQNRITSLPSLPKSIEKTSNPAKNSVSDSGKKPDAFPSATIPKKTEDQQGQNTVQAYYSLQVGAMVNEIDPLPQNFKGEKNIFRIKVPPYSKFYSGKFSTYEEAVTEKSRIINKFPDAFIVIIEKNIPRAFSRK